jgi:hypothetical protein
MKKVLLFLLVIFTFGPSLQAKEVLGRDEEIKELREKIRQLELRIEELAVRPLPTPVDVERRALVLPDISIVGDIVGTFSDDKKKTDRNKIVARKVELSLQGYLMPGMRADVFIDLHRHDGEYKVGLHEGYISFLQTPIPGLGMLAGKKLIGFGKLNPRHSHHWDFVDMPMVLESYFTDHGLAGQGVNFSYLLPLPFFAQWDLGAWYIDAHHKDHGHSHGHGHHHDYALELADQAYSTRLWSSFALAEAQELEIGLSGLKGYDAHDYEVKISGLDLTYRYFGPGASRWLFQNEFLFLNKEAHRKKDVDRWGFYSFLNYRWDMYWNVGLRYDWMETLSKHKKDKSSISGILTRNLTETTKLRLQYTHNLEEKNDTVFLQAIFGIGPHAHPLE